MPWNWYSPFNGFKGAFKMNLGAEYEFILPFERIDTLCVRAGYIYDPQPYQLTEGFARSYFCTGFGLGVGRFEINAAAKISLISKELQHFHTNLFQVGLSCKL